MPKRLKFFAKGIKTPLFSSVIIFFMAMVLSYILAFILLFIAKPPVEKTIFMKCSRSFSINEDSIIEYFINKGAKNIKIIKQRDFLMITYHQRGFTSANITPPKELIKACKPKRITLHKNIFTLPFFSFSWQHKFLF